VSGHDINYMAQGGALQLFAERGHRPIVPGLSIADVGGGSLTAVFGILTALLARERTGRGQFVDISMLDGVLSWLTYHGADYLFADIEPRGGERPFLGLPACYNVYTCADGRYLSLGIIEEHFWERFCNLIGRPDLKDKQWPEGEDAETQYKEVAACFATGDCATWVKRLTEADIPAAPVNTMAEAFNDPQVRHREMLQYLDHPVEGRIPQFGFPVKFSETPARMKTPPPLLGEHTEEILAACGYDESEIRRLHEEGVV
jgi:crotonobetainyl-CoA:carnitine CoA-transferase CaiB-like acyl-CoA transferase